jgi:type I site-specific restriction endonuclease
MDKRSLSERDICTKFITPALRKVGWDEMSQIREEVGFTTEHSSVVAPQLRTAESRVGV